jgi:hypothetical protein
MEAKASQAVQSATIPATLGHAKSQSPKNLLLGSYYSSLLYS